MATLQGKSKDGLTVRRVGRQAGRQRLSCGLGVYGARVELCGVGSKGRFAFPEAARVLQHAPGRPPVRSMRRANGAGTRRFADVHMVRAVNTMSFRAPLM